MTATTTEERPRVPLGRTPAGHPLPTLAERSRGRPSTDSALIGWAASLAVTALALFLRLWHLGRPHAFSFDETYYAKDAWSMANFGYVRSYTEGADDRILAGHTRGSWADDPSMIVHPEVGKWMIAAGERLLGMDPVGWRVSAAVTGALMVLVMIRLARRLTGSTVLGLLAGLLLAFDGLQFVLSRLALLDIFVAFWTLLAVHLLVMDRDSVRARLARHRPDGPSGSWAPFLLLRPWLLLSGVAWGLAIGTKWTPVYALAAFGLLAWAWTAGARRAAGTRAPVLRSLLADAPSMVVQLVGTAAVVYVATWSGWLVHAQEYEEHLSANQYTRFVSWDGTCDEQSMANVVSDDDARWPTATEADATGLGELTQSLRSLAYYHRDVLTFHTHFLDCSEHTYASKPIGWLLLNRPVGVDAQNDIQPGRQGCAAPQDSSCLRQVLLLGNPVLWWGSLVALAASVVLWLGARDWRHGVAVVGVAATWLPWLLYDDRPIFSFYAVLTLPFLVLSCTLVAGRIIGTGGVGRRRTLGVVAVGSFLVLTVASFAWFWPIWTDQLVTRHEWLLRIWFQRWI